jgi:transposase
VPRHSPHGLHEEKGASGHGARRVREGGLEDDGIRSSATRAGLLFVDECGTHTSLAPIYGYAPRDERLYLPMPRNRGNTTLLSSMTTDGMGQSLAVGGATTAAVFETYVEKVLVPSLRPGQLVVTDNLSAHKPKRVRKLIEVIDCKLLYLPAYSPDYNPIEETFSKIKRFMHKVGARTKDALVEAIGRALSADTAGDAWGYFGHAGYRPTGQIL